MLGVITMLMSMGVHSPSAQVLWPEDASPHCVSLSMHPLQNESISCTGLDSLYEEASLDSSSSLQNQQNTLDGREGQNVGSRTETGLLIDSQHNCDIT